MFVGVIVSVDVFVGVKEEEGVTLGSGVKVDVTVWEGVRLGGIVMVKVGTSEGVGVKRSRLISWGMAQEIMVMQMKNARIVLREYLKQAPWVFSFASSHSVLPARKHDRCARACFR